MEVLLRTMAVVEQHLAEGLTVVGRKDEQPQVEMKEVELRSPKEVLITISLMRYRVMFGTANYTDSENGNFQFLVKMK